MSGSVYQKTLLGMNEINHRSDAISGKLRRLLIMIDGRKDVDQLKKMAPLDDIENALRELQEKQLIEPHRTTMADLIAGSIH